jgi:exodeoxyribonuclease III
MKLISWNINGIRASIKKDLWSKIDELKPDILCVQETKADKDIMSQDIVKHDDYDLAFNSCDIKKGYSGVANYINNRIVGSTESDLDLGMEEFDQEGRFVCTKFKYKDFKIALINCYYPQGGRDFRIPFKINFYHNVLEKALKYRKEGYKILLCGDFNTTFADIDLARPKENRNTTGCLPIERDALNDMVKYGFVDYFRLMYPDKEGVYSYWDQITRARERNVGWRIDFFLVDEDLIEFCEDIEVRMDIMGSDHCPVVLNLK